MEKSQNLITPKKKAELLNLTFTPEMESGTKRKTRDTKNITSSFKNEKTNSSPKILIPKLKKEDGLQPLKISPGSSDNPSYNGGNTLVHHTTNRLSTNKSTLSMEAQNAENYPQKRPAKLAPLELPTEVKVAQLKKIQAMKDKDYPDIKKRSFHAVRSKMVLTEHLAKVESLNKGNMAENALYKLKKDFSETKGPAAEDCLSVPWDYPMSHEDPQGLPSKLKAKMSVTVNSTINSTQVSFPHSSGKSRFRNLEKQCEQTIQFPASTTRLNVETTLDKMGEKN